MLFDLCGSDFVRVFKNVCCIVEPVVLPDSKRNFPRQLYLRLSLVLEFEVLVDDGSCSQVEGCRLSPHESTHDHETELVSMGLTQI